MEVRCASCGAKLPDKWGPTPAKVWVVELVVPYEPGEVEAVFSTKEAAEAYADRRQAKETTAGFYAKEYEIDKPLR